MSLAIGVGIAVPRRDWAGSSPPPPPPPPPPPGGFAVLMEATSVTGIGSTISFLVNDTLLASLTVTDEGTGVAGPLRVVARTDASIVEGSGFLDSDTPHDLQWRGVGPWPGPDGYVEIDSSLLVPGANTARIEMAGPGGEITTLGDGSLLVVRVEQTDGVWEYAYDGIGSVKVLVEMFTGTLEAGEFLEVEFQDEIVQPEPTEFAFAQVDADEFTLDWGTIPEDYSMRVEYSTNNADWYLLGSFTPSDFPPQTFDNFDPATGDPATFTPGNSYYMRARYEVTFLNPKRYGNWVASSFVAV